LLQLINKTVYLCVGLNNKGYKEVLGMWIGKTESSSFWMSVLTDLKSRGVEDILITVTDNLNGFTETIKTVFPKSTTQICVVHQIRNSCKYAIFCIHVISDRMRSSDRVIHEKQGHHELL
jgi:transposase-like protein